MLGKPDREATSRTWSIRAEAWGCRATAGRRSSWRQATTPPPLRPWASYAPSLLASTLSRRRWAPPPRYAARPAPLGRLQCSSLRLAACCCLAIPAASPIRRRAGSPAQTTQTTAPTRFRLSLSRLGHAVGRHACARVAAASLPVSGTRAQVLLQVPVICTESFCADSTDTHWYRPPIGPDRPHIGAWFIPGYHRVKTKSQQFTSRFRLTPLAGLHLVHYPTLALPGKPESYQSTQVFAAGRKLVSSALSEQVSASPRQRHPPVLQPRLWSRISESTRADTDYESTCLPVQRSHPARSRARIIARASGVIRLAAPACCRGPTVGPVHETDAQWRHAAPDHDRAGITRGTKPDSHIVLLAWRLLRQTEQGSSWIFGRLADGGPTMHRDRWCQVPG